MKEDYEKAKSECWENFNRLGGREEEIGKKATFDYAYNAAFNLGKAHSKNRVNREIYIGDRVKIVGTSNDEGKVLIGNVGEVLDVDVRNDKYFVLYKTGQAWIRRCDLVPYTTLEEELIGNLYPPFYPHLPNSTGAGKRSPKQTDEDKKMLRLKIAAQMAHGLLASPVDANMQSKDVEYITKEAFRYADALISENEKYD